MMKISHKNGDISLKIGVGGAVGKDLLALGVILLAAVGKDLLAH